MEGWYVYDTCGWRRRIKERTFCSSGRRGMMIVVAFKSLTYVNREWGKWARCWWLMK